MMIAPRFRLVCLAGLLGLAACGGTPSVVNVAVTGSSDLNTYDGIANPVQVRLYQLKSTDKFTNADYFQLADKEAATLGDQLITREDQFIHPGQTTNVAITTKPGVRFIGIAAAYRDIDHATWRVTAPVAEHIPVSRSADAVQLGTK